MPAAYRTIAHTADIGIRAGGRDPAEAFVNAARGMFALITDRRKVRPRTTREIEVTAGDRAELLVEWLNELLFYFDAEQWLARDFRITELSETTLKAVVRGEKVDHRRHTLKRGIKSATYHMLKIESSAEGYLIEVLLDI